MINSYVGFLLTKEFVELESEVSVNIDDIF